MAADGPSEQPSTSKAKSKQGKSQQSATNSGEEEDEVNGTSNKTGVVQCDQEIFNSAGFKKALHKLRASASNGTISKSIKCTTCGGLVSTRNTRNIRKHISLHVLMCKKCSDYFGTGIFSKDENGIDEYCRWCAEGGNLLCCDFCSNAFCKECIRRNFGRTGLAEIRDSKEWKCYICEPKALTDLMAACSFWLNKEDREAKKKSKERKSAQKMSADSDSEDGDNEHPKVLLKECFDQTIEATEMLANAVKSLRKRTTKVRGDYERYASLVKKLQKALSVTKENLVILEESTTFCKQKVEAKAKTKTTRLTNGDAASTSKTKTKTSAKGATKDTDEKEEKSQGEAKTTSKSSRKNKSKHNSDNDEDEEIMIIDNSETQNSNSKKSKPNKEPEDDIIELSGNNLLNGNAQPDPDLPNSSSNVDDLLVEIETSAVVTPIKPTPLTINGSPVMASRAESRRLHLDSESESDHECIVPDIQSSDDEISFKNPEIVTPSKVNQDTSEILVSDSDNEGESPIGDDTSIVPETPTKADGKATKKRTVSTDSTTKKTKTDKEEVKKTTKSEGKPTKNGTDAPTKKTKPVLDNEEAKKALADLINSVDEGNSEDESATSPSKNDKKSTSTPSKKSSKGIKQKSDEENTAPTQRRKGQRNAAKSKTISTDSATNKKASDNDEAKKALADFINSDDEGSEDESVPTSSKNEEMSKSNLEESNKKSTPTLSKKSSKGIKQESDEDATQRRKGLRNVAKSRTVSTDSATNKNKKSLDNDKAKKADYVNSDDDWNNEDESAPTSKVDGEDDLSTQRRKSSRVTKHDSDKEKESTPSLKKKPSKRDKDSSDEENEPTPSSKQKASKQDKEDGDEEKEVTSSPKKKTSKVEKEKGSKEEEATSSSKKKVSKQNKEKSDEEVESSSSSKKISKRSKENSDEENTIPTRSKLKSGKSKADTNDHSDDDDENSDELGKGVPSSKKKISKQDKEKSDEEKEATPSLKKKTSKQDKKNSDEEKKPCPSSKKKSSKRESDDENTITSSSKSKSGKSKTDKENDEENSDEETTSSSKTKTSKRRNENGDKEKEPTSKKKISKRDQENSDNENTSSSSKSKSDKSKAKKEESSDEGENEHDVSTKTASKEAARSLLAGVKESEEGDADGEEDAAEEPTSPKKSRAKTGRKESPKKESVDEKKDKSSSEDESEEDEATDSSDDESTAKKRKSARKSRRNLNKSSAKKKSTSKSKKEESGSEATPTYVSSDDDKKKNTRRTSHKGVEKGKNVKLKVVNLDKESDEEKKKKTRKKKSESDSDIDKEISKLGKKLGKPKKGSGKKKSSKNESEDEQDDSGDQSGDDKNTNKGEKGKKEPKGSKLLDMSEGEESDKDQESGSEPDLRKDIKKRVEVRLVKLDENILAKNELKDSLMESSGEDDEESDEGDIKKKEKTKKESKEEKTEVKEEKLEVEEEKPKEKKDKDEDDVVKVESDEDFEAPKKKKARKHCPLLTINLDSDSEEGSGSKSKKKRKRNSSEEENKSKKKKVKKSEDDSSQESSDSDKETKKKKKTKKGDDNSSSDFKSSDSDKKTKKKGMKKKKKGGSDSGSVVELNSDSSDEAPAPRRKTRSSKKKGDSSSDEDSEPAPAVKKRRKRIVTVDSSGEASEDEEGDSQKVGKGRKNLRKIIKDKNLTDTTRAAAKEEEERKQRVTGLQKLYNEVTEGVDTHGYKITTKLALEKDGDEEVVTVHADLIKKLKPHQVEGVKFMWGAVIESVKRSKEHEGSGCILAHCMGLGKTLQVVSFVHTVMSHEVLGISRVIVVCPVNTILNWVHEFDYWLEDEDNKLDVSELSSVKNNYQRMDRLKDWHEDGGVLVMGYDMFRTLAQEKGKRISKRQREVFHRTLIDPGPDLVVCDEGHILKNDATALSKAMNRIRTRRRIVLTGTPLQNNLSEYHCMVSFVKPNLLGTGKEFKNRFVNPISNGQCADSTDYDFKMMQRRSHILHNLLDGCVQRRDYSVLTPFLPPKHEYILSVKLSEVQIKLYQDYLDKYARGKSSVRSGLFADYQNLMKIWTHPWVLRLAEIRDENKASNDTDDSFLDDSTPATSDSEEEKKEPANSANKKDSSNDDVSSGDEEEVVKKHVTSTRASRSARRAGNDDGAGTSKEEPVVEPPFSNGWWTEYVKEDDATNMELSGKLILLFDILQSCMDIGDKVLVFSQSLLSLDLIEDMLERQDSQEREVDLLNESVEEKVKTTWICGQDYFRMDGSTALETRKRQCEAFNDNENYRARLFLISTRAGGLGINLVAANRVIVFDASWNPTHDVQSIFRVYRFGQKKPVYIYRFLAQGTMEEKIYERQVTKQSLACRVVDEQQIERHFNASDLQELYCFEPESSAKKATPIVPKDRLLAELLIRRKEWIVGYHEHDSLLENKESEILSEEDRKAAWEEYENEKKGLLRAANAAIGGMGNMNWQMQMQMQQQSTVPIIPNIDVHRIIGIIQQQNPGLTQEMLVAKVQNTIIQLRSQQRWVGVQAAQFRQQGADRDRVEKLEQQVHSYTYLIISLERWLQGMMGRSRMILP